MTDAQKRASIKYLKKKDLVQLRLPQGYKQRLKDSASAAGLSVNEYCMRKLFPDNV